MASMSQEQGTPQTLQAPPSRRLLRRHSTPVEPMEPISEEKSALAMEIADAVVESLNIEAKLEEKITALRLRGDKIFLDMQQRQEQTLEALGRTVGMCLESQRTFHQEHQRLVAAVKELATIVMPFAQQNQHAARAQLQAASLIQHSEVFQARLQAEDTRLSTCAVAAAASMSSLPSAPLNGEFTVTLRKASEVSLGLNVQAEDDATLIIGSVLPDGAVDSWNRQWIGNDGNGERVVVAGDRITKVNDTEGDVEKMLAECAAQRLVKLHLTRGPANAQARAAATLGARPELAAALDTSDGATNSDAASAITPTKGSECAPPPGLDLSPPKQRQPLVAPPGIFFPNPENQNKGSTADFDDALKGAASSVVDSVLAQGYSEFVQK